MRYICRPPPPPAAATAAPSAGQKKAKKDTCTLFSSALPSSLLTSAARRRYALHLPAADRSQFNLTFGERHNGFLADPALYLHFLLFDMKGDLYYFV